MKYWRMAMVLFVVISASSVALMMDDSDADSTVLPKVASVEYDSSAGTDLKIVTDVPLGIIVCQYYVYDSHNVIQLHGPATSSSNYFYLDTSIATAGYLADDDFKIYLYNTQGTPYLFSIYKISFNGNGTSMKTQTVHVSSDSLGTVAMPAGFIWNTKSDGSGTWVSDLDSVDFEDNAVTLYAFKGNNIGITVGSSTSMVTPGSDAVVLVDLSSNAGAAEIDLSIEYDRSVLTLERVENSRIFSVDKGSLREYPYPAVFTASENVRTVGNLLRLTFAVSSDAAVGQYPVIVNVTLAEDVNGKVIPKTVYGCAVTIGDRISGDVDANGRIDDNDAASVKRYLANMTSGIDSSRMDLNGDGEINALDSLLMAKYMANMTVSFADPGESEDMTVADSDGENVTVRGIHPGSNVFIVAGEGQSVTASSSAGSIDVAAAGENRYSLVAPAAAFTVRIS